MKIVHCIFGMNTGGAEVLTVALLNEMCRHHDVSIVIVNDDWSNSLLLQVNPKVKIYFINRKEGSYNPFPFINLNILLFKLKPDIIHCHDPKMGRVIKVRSAKVLYTIHAMDIPVDHYHHYDLLVAISDAVHANVASRCSALIKTIYNGIPEQYFTRRSGFSLREEEPIRIVQVSRLEHENKGHDILLHALAKIKSEGNANFVLDFIGIGRSFAHLVKLVHQLGLDSNVNFIGEKERQWLYNNLSEYHLLVQPSRYEGFGLTLLEGIAAGIPVLASNIDGPGEIIRRTSGGLLFESGDIQSCADSLAKIFKLYKEGKMAEFMSQVKGLTEAEYSISTCAMNYSRVYLALAKPSLMAS